MPEDYVSGFEFQPMGLHYGLCGTYAFAHTMLLLGIPMEIDVAKRTCKSKDALDFIPDYLRHPIISYRDKVGGTEEEDLVSALEKAGFHATCFDDASESQAKSTLTKYLRQSVPVILNVSNTSHWCVAAGLIGGKVVLIDSAPEGKRKQIISLYTWKQLMEYWWAECRECEGAEVIECETCEGDGWYDCGYCKGDGCGHCKNKGWGWCKDCKGNMKIECPECDGRPYTYGGIAVRPKAHTATHRDTVARTLKQLPALAKESDLAEWWGYYLSDLQSIFVLNKEAKGDVITAKRFFELYQEAICEATDDWIAPVSTSSIEFELECYATVATTLGFVIPKLQIDRALIEFTTVFNATIWEFYV